MLIYEGYLNWQNVSRENLATTVEQRVNDVSAGLIKAVVGAPLKHRTLGDCIADASHGDSLPKQVGQVYW